MYLVPEKPRLFFLCLSNHIPKTRSHMNNTENKKKELDQSKHALSHVYCSHKLPYSSVRFESSTSFKNPCNP